MFVPKKNLIIFFPKCGNAFHLFHCNEFNKQKKKATTTKFAIAKSTQNKNKNTKKKTQNIYSYYGNENTQK